MLKKYIQVFLLVICMIFLCSCSGGHIVHIDERKMANEKIEQIITALKAKDKDSIKALYSNKAISISDAIDSDIDRFFEFVKGSIISWEIDNGVDSEKSIEKGKKSLMLRYGVLIKTDIDDYYIFVIDYTKDTINPDNEGVYMLEISKQSYSGEWASWQERMVPGISIIE